MECKTIKSFKKNGKPFYFWKVAHLRLELAEKEAIRINNKKANFIKRVAYKCSKCGKYHVGTSFEMIENKNPTNRGWLGKSMKVIGQIELQNPTKKTKPIVEKLFLKNNVEVNETIRKLIYDRIAETFWIKGEKFKYFVKQSIILVILPDGKIKKPKIKDIILGEKRPLTNNLIKNFIKEKYENSSFNHL